MTIVAYVGRPGSGKSYGVVENIIIPALKAGRTVVTNIPLKIGYLSDDFPQGKIVQFDPSDPLDNAGFWDHDLYSGAIWVIDECWRYWSSGTTAKQIPNDEKQFFTEHRHCVGEDGKTSEIVLVTQALSQIASFVRDLVEETYRATKLRAVGASGRFRIDIFDGPFKQLDGGKPHRQLLGKYKDEIFKYYVSHTNNKTDFAAGAEEIIDDRGNIWKSPFIRYGLPCAVLFIFYSIYSLVGYLDRFSENEKDVAPAPAQIQFDRFTPSDIPKVKSSKPIDVRTERLALLKMKMEKNDFFEEVMPVSTTHRIVGLINNMFMIWTKEGTFNISSGACSKFSYTKEDYCVYNQELVTWYSSSVPSDDVLNRNYIEGSLLDGAF